MYMVNAVPAIELQLLSANCKAIVVPSQGALRETMRYIKSPGATEKASVVRPAYPIQPDNEHVQNGPFTIVTIGNKFWGKGIPIAIEVFRVLRERLGANIRMVLVCGDIPAGYVLPQGLLVVSVLNMSEGMRREIYREANVFVFPCLHDSFGVYLEAMAYGVPMIATRIYDKEEVIVDGQTGFLVHTPISMYDGAFGIDWKSWDHFQEVIKTMFERGGFSDMVDDIVSKLELLVNDIGLVRSMGKAAQKLQREYFSPERKNRQIVQIYDRVLRSL